MREIKADKEAKENTRAISRFKILTHIDNDVRAHPEVLFMDFSLGSEHEIDYDVDYDKVMRRRDYGTMVSLHSTFTQTGRFHCCGVDKGLSPSSQGRGA